MTLTPDQRKQLDAPLSREHVKTRKGGANGLSYVEGWHVIAECNRIFGAGSWGYDVEVTQAWCEQLDDGDKGKRWHVTYTARCALMVDGNGDKPCPPIVDHGAGHGIDRDRGLAIESALKEAATDALKRCAKSYGNVLGLALYDKLQANVSDRPSEADVAEALVILIEAGAPNAKAETERLWPELGDESRKMVKAAVAAKKASGK